MLGIKTAICAPSIWPDLCISSRGCSVTCRRASLTSFRGYDPHVANSAGNGGLPPRHPLRLRRWLEGNTHATAASATKKTVRSFSSANDTDPRSVPNQLKGLIQGEEMLIAKGCLVMRVYRLKGGQRGYGGHVVNLAQNIGGFVNSLPRPARDLPIIVVWRQGGKGTHKDLLVRRQRVFTALNWLRANITAQERSHSFWAIISLLTHSTLGA